MQARRDVYLEECLFVANKVALGTSALNAVVVRTFRRKDRCLRADMEARLFSNGPRLLSTTRDTSYTSGCRLFDCICNCRVATGNWTRRVAITALQFRRYLEGAINCSIRRDKRVRVFLEFFKLFPIRERTAVTNASIERVRREDK